ncbi:MAG: hypothetical protein JWM38_1782 [Sphingomonas bacterium]|nr:hypothetical protein [Sphingomonas bacterium]
MQRQPPNAPEMPTGWWSTRAFAVALILLSAVPLLWPSTAPLIDLPGHMARYRVELGIHDSPALARYYGFEWALMGNLGVDLLVVPLTPIFGLELAVKLIVLTIPVMTVAGLLLIAREEHGTLPPTAAFALPLAYGYPFQFGFVNFALSMALALLAFGLWLRLGRLGRVWLRAGLFVPIGAVVWLAHGFGWGVLGLLVFASETVRQRQHEPRLIPAAFRAGLACLPLAPPLLLMVMWRSGNVAGQTADWFNWTSKLTWIVTVLRDRWALFDLASELILLGLLIAGFVRRAGLTMNWTLRICTLMLFLAFILLPRILLGSAYADMRLVSYMLAIGLIAVAPARADPRRLRMIAILATAFFLVRTTATTISFAGYANHNARQLEALEHVEPGSRVLALTEKPCRVAWSLSRMDHLGGFAVVRRDVFINDNWVMAGAQLMRLRYHAGRFSVDPSQMVEAPGCRFRGRPGLAEAIRTFPRDRFDYVWLIDGVTAHVPPAGLRMLWRSPTGALYRIVGSATTASETPNGSVRRPTQ